MAIWVLCIFNFLFCLIGLIRLDLVFTYMVKGIELPEQKLCRPLNITHLPKHPNLDLLRFACTIWIGWPNDLCHMQMCRELWVLLVTLGECVSGSLITAEGALWSFSFTVFYFPHHSTFCVIYVIWAFF